MEINTKYDIGDIVYIMDRNKIVKTRIRRCDIVVTKQGTNILYQLFKKKQYKESDLSRSKESLIMELNRKMIFLTGDEYEE